MRRALLALLLGLWFVAPPLRADDDAEMAGWKQRLDQAQADLVGAREHAVAAHAAYVEMRHNRSVRGEEKAKIIAERAQSEHAVEEAQARLDALREEARRAGVPPAWVLPDPPAEASPDS
jgi:recombinational DNA repair ATPase RecF